MKSFPLLAPETFFQAFAKLNAVEIFSESDRKSMPMLDKYGYFPSNTGGKISQQCWRKRDYGNPNENDLSIGVAWHESEAEACAYYSTLVTKSLSVDQPFDGLAMPGSDDLAVGAVSIPEFGNILQVVVRYGNYVFNMTVLGKPDGYFPSNETFENYAKAFDEGVIIVLANGS